MAGTVTVAEVNIGPVRKITFTWTSDAAGQADGTTTEYYNGRVIFAAQVPDGGGTQPTDLYDAVVENADELDVLAGQGANISNAAKSYKSEKDGLGAVADSKLTLHVTNAGNAKGGKTILFIR